MDIHDATEIAYKNGYEQGKKDAVKHGRWIDGTCSECHFDALCAPCSDVQIYTDYCPNCGAKLYQEDK